MTKDEIKQFLKDKPGYLKEGAQRLADKLECSLEDCKDALREARIETMHGFTCSQVVNDNFNIDAHAANEFDEFVKSNAIDKKDIQSVKYWQNMGGESRFSVVVKSEDNVLQSTKQAIIDLLVENSPTSIPRPKKCKKCTPEERDPVVYEVSLPDIHYGKHTGQTLEEAEDAYMDVIEELMKKSIGLDIDKILLPVGNDGMNSEGLSRATTKGTPQFDSADWKETFVGYCALMVKAINYLAQYADVDVVVIQGNHDYERMFYSGEYLNAYFTNDTRVSIDNSYDHRKYYEYGTNMILFTHGDKVKAADMPLIMATEQPEMFARTTSREAHCGHLHKEMVNEYRGIKVRFIPSICKNDDWHKMMGYEAKRTGQAHIWNKQRGYEGYLQINV